MKGMIVVNMGDSRVAVDVVIDGEKIEGMNTTSTAVNGIVEMLSSLWGINTVETHVAGKVFSQPPRSLNPQMQRIDFSVDGDDESLWFPVGKAEGDFWNTAKGIFDGVITDVVYGPTCSGELYRETFDLPALIIENDEGKMMKRLSWLKECEDKMALDFESWTPPKPKPRSSFSQKAAFWENEYDRAMRKLERLQDRLRGKQAKIDAHDGENREVSEYFHMGRVGGSGPRRNLDRLNRRKEAHAEKAWGLLRELDGIKAEIMGAEMRMAYCDRRYTINKGKAKENE